jgi:transposase InsO family protein
MTQPERDIRRRLAVLAHAQGTRNISKTCRFYGISRETFYEWRRAYRSGGEAGLVPRRPGPTRPMPNQYPPELVAKILRLRREFHFGAQRIVWHLQRYEDLKVSVSGVAATLRRHGLARLPRGTPIRSLVSCVRYEKATPGHHVQVDVKFVDLTAPTGEKVRRFQYTAIDDATRIRALRVYSRHNQDNAIDFLDHVVRGFPFRICQIRTDNGHEFQARFHWHVEDLGIEHVYIKPCSPRLNGKVERSHRTDAVEFYQLLSYTDDVDLGKKLEEWERFYNLARPHGAHGGKTPYEVLRERLS